MKIGQRVYTDDPASRYASVGVIIAKRSDWSFTWKRGIKINRRYIVKLINRATNDKPQEGSFAAALLNVVQAFNGVSQDSEALKDLAIYNARDLFAVVDLPTPAPKVKGLGDNKGASV